MIAFDRSQSRGAYVRGTLHINHFETSWQIPGPCAWRISTTEIPSQNDDDLYSGVLLAKVAARAGYANR